MSNNHVTVVYSWTAHPDKLDELTADQLDEFIVGYLRDRLSKGNAIAHRPGWIRERSAAV